MTQQELELLLKKYREGAASHQERALLEQWYHSFEYDAAIFTDEARIKELKEGSWQSITETIRPVSIPLYRRRWFSVAAAVLLIAACFWLWNNGRNAARNKQLAQQITPAGSKATLTLGDGSVVVLDSNTKQSIVDANGITILNENNNLLSYKHQAAERPAAPVFNTLTTPRGGRYQLVLPDGTKVWMNSASSLRYPTQFWDKERIVELSGEAYFEVAQNAAQPFKVKLSRALVHVLGTSFNINAYTDEPLTKTTLVTGAVRVSGIMPQNGESMTLPVGYQAITGDAYMSMQKASISQVLSWKNGLFVFEDMKLAEILREISRWYDIDIEVRAPVSNESYGGVINRNSSLAKVVETLEKNGIQHFKIEGRKLIVLP